MLARDPPGPVGDPGPRRAGERTQPGGLADQRLGLRGELGEVGLERVVVVHSANGSRPATRTATFSARAQSTAYSSQASGFIAGGLGFSPSGTAASRPCAGTSTPMPMTSRMVGITSSTAIQKCHTTARTGLMVTIIRAGRAAPHSGALRPGRIGPGRAASPGSTPKSRSWASTRRRSVSGTAS